jgi:hypothetical protein
MDNKQLKELLLALVLTLVISSLALAFSIELRWTQNAPTDKVVKYNVYRCMSSVLGHYSTCKPRPGKDPKYTNMSSVKFPSYTTATTKIMGLTGAHKIYLTAVNKEGLESGASNVVFEYDQYGKLTIRLIKE